VWAAGRFLSRARLTGHPPTCEGRLHSLIPSLNALRLFCRRAFGRVYGPYALRRIARGGVVHLRGRALLTDPEVLHPIHFLSTRVLVDAVTALDLGGRRFLDMGAGSGAIGIFAAAAGAQVTACDINPRAVTLTRQNFERNQLRGEVLESNLFAALPGRAFDLICFNLPFYEGEPKTPFETALFGGRDLGTVRAFAAGCPAALTRDGSVLVLFSEDARRESILRHFCEAGLILVEERVASQWFERFHLARFRAKPPR